MASSRLIAPFRQCHAISKISLNKTVVRFGHLPPPMPPFARNAVPTEPLVENNDAVWDDGVAPEAALDFDCQHIPKEQGYAAWFSGLAFFGVMLGLVSLTNPEDKNPAVDRTFDSVMEPQRTGPPPKLI